MAFDVEHPIVTRLPEAARGSSARILSNAVRSPEGLDDDAAVVITVRSFPGV